MNIGLRKCEKCAQFWYDTTGKMRCDKCGGRGIKVSD